MKIALLGSKDYDSLEYHLNDSLTYLGHEVFYIDISDVINIPFKYNYWGRKLFPKYDNFLFKKITDKILDFKPDLFIGTYRFIHPNVIKTIKNELPSVVTVQINPDQLTTLEHQQIFASDYDFYFTKDRFMLDFMKNKMNLNTYYLPEAFNPRVHKPVEKDRRELEKVIGIDVVAFGTMYPYRAKLISEIIKRNIDVTLFGVADKRFPRSEISANFRNEYITGERKAEVLMGSKIVLNNFHFAEIESANVKFFEISGIGAFQICDYKPVLEEYTNIGIETITYKSLDEAFELIQYYLEKPDLRYEISNAQRKHFLKNHTYEIRLKQMLEIIG
ncbi:CgeB family protein [Elizabethkingia anophelis]|uniref:CgeB family protein n=1 Tax=Elizabethkingia anophelis TaxID=1117645 RepID=UPI00201392A2|nr:glycosyltransferase [Elizabethkingia anophelis]EJC8061658.1 glycosyltransferase [Elizabethkingia anophelis]MCL1642581.1 glycosyltransferase [Elizabethkingia anophelis]MCL1645830.1 glycosyltransferase [Elizabethkingia anophelis]MCT3927192.1 glycosyltransferase [Elizabethkingia anophelis]MCT4034787.1 glycosyltransferase [Elizabethkingia anophelis]